MKLLCFTAVTIRNNFLSIDLQRLDFQISQLVRHPTSNIAIAVYVGCICGPVISVRVLHLSHNNLVNLQLMYLLLRILYNLSIPNYCYLSGARLLSVSLHCTVQFLKYVPVASIIGRQVWEPGVCDLRWGSLLQYSRQLQRAYILGPFNIDQLHWSVESVIWAPRFR